jgi:formate hydrogenlyase subunit 3/multisubunit Na+/H+ antiporter MnhD subunit
VKRTLPVSGALWIAGFLSITGAPPFGTFLSEFTILKAALAAGHFWVAALYLVFLALIFVGMANIVLPMVQGEPSVTHIPENRREPAWSIAPPLALTTLVLVLGLWIPSWLDGALHEAAGTQAGKSGVGSQIVRLVAGQRSEVRGQKSEVRHQRSVFDSPTLIPVRTRYSATGH